MFISNAYDHNAGLSMLFNNAYDHNVDWQRFEVLVPRCGGSALALRWTSSSICYRGGNYLQAGVKDV